MQVSVRKLIIGSASASLLIVFTICLWLTAGQSLMAFVVPLPGLAGLYRLEGTQFSQHSMPANFDMYSLMSVFCVIVLVGLYSSVVGVYWKLFLLLGLVMSLAMYFANWQVGFGVFVMTGVIVVMFTLKLLWPVQLVCGLGLFISLYTFTSFQQILEQNKTGNEESVEVSLKMVAFTVVLAGMLGLPLLAIGSLSGTGYVGIGGEGTESVMTQTPDEVSISLNSLLKLTVVLALGLIGSVLLLWIIRRITRDRNTEEEMPMPEDVDVETDTKKQASSSRSLQPVVRGGKAGEIMNRVHDLLTFCQDRGFERETGETVETFLNRLCLEIDLPGEEVDYVNLLYNGARYGCREPSGDELDRALEIADRLEREIRSL
ncbi:MAG: DUF4129 domain-containing protein [bacterium]